MGLGRVVLGCERWEGLGVEGAPGLLEGLEGGRGHLLFFDRIVGCDEMGESFGSLLCWWMLGELRRLMFGGDDSTRCRAR